MTEDLERMFRAAIRELAFRERAYPGWIKSKRMSEAEAQQELQNMRDIVDHFRRLLGERDPA